MSQVWENLTWDPTMRRVPRRRNQRRVLQGQRGTRGRADFGLTGRGKDPGLRVASRGELPDPRQASSLAECSGTASSCSQQDPHVRGQIRVGDQSVRHQLGRSQG